MFLTAQSSRHGTIQRIWAAFTRIKSTPTYCLVSTEMSGPWRLDLHSPLLMETDGSTTTMETRLQKTARQQQTTTPKNQLTFLWANNTIRAYKNVFDTLLRRSLHDSNVKLTNAALYKRGGRPTTHSRNPYMYLTVRRGVKVAMKFERTEIHRYWPFLLP